LHAAGDGIQHTLILQAVFESWLDAFSSHNGFHEIGNRVNEAVFVADDVTGRPPTCRCTDELVRSRECRGNLVDLSGRRRRKISIDSFLRDRKIMSQRCR
jgi:hypothetical protein